MKYRARATPIEFQSVPSIELTDFLYFQASWMQCIFLRKRERERDQANGFQDISFHKSDLWPAFEQISNEFFPKPSLDNDGKMQKHRSPSIPAAIRPSLRFILLNSAVEFSILKGDRHVQPRHEYCTVTMARNDRFIVTHVDFTPLGDGSSGWTWSREQGRFDCGGGIFLYTSLGMQKEW